MPQPKQQTNQAQSEPDLRPGFRTPRAGGSYLLDPDDLGKAGAEPIFVEGTDMEATTDEEKAANKIRSKAKKQSSQPAADE